MSALLMILSLSYAAFVGMADHAAGQIWTAETIPRFVSQWAWTPCGAGYRLYWGANAANWNDLSARYYEQYRVAGDWVVLDGWSLFGEQTFLAIRPLRVLFWRDLNAPAVDLTAAFPSGQPYALEQVPDTPYAYLVEAELVDTSTGLVVASFRDYQTWEAASVSVAFGLSAPGLRQSETFQYLQLPAGSSERAFSSVMTITAQQIGAESSGTLTRTDGSVTQTPRQGTRYHWTW